MTREQVMSALWGLFTPMVVPPNITPTPSQPFAYASRRFQLWTDIPAANKPALFMTEPDEQDDRIDLSEPNSQTLHAFLWIYIDSSDRSQVPIIAMNNLIDTVRAALAPNPLSGVQNLGGLITDVSVVGKTMKDPGDLDNNGVAKIPLRIIVPAF